MTNEAFNQLVKELQAGNEKVLDQLFIKHYEYCVNYLSREFHSGNHYCSNDDARDTVMDSFLKLRTELLKGKVENKNIRGYLLIICRNMWLKKVQKERSKLSLDIEKVEYYLGQKEDLYNEDFNPLLKKELASDLKETQKMQAEIFQAAWAKLGEKCRKLLQAFYIEKIKLKDLQERFDYSSYDTIKSMRRKCYNGLLKWKDKIMEN
ncbi:MAG: sigma-70 family RNA polymerase sigma factor [Saprospiraceae bacterium]|jgi:RNA polymerase sigma factor (sigma-70 family)|nr:sigma-70 family RNA polymerase sigma factor [Saprospiraceae bacterium]